MDNFKINNFLTLKLENNKTYIYIKEEKFIQCKFLLIERSLKKIKNLAEIQSIDEFSNNIMEKSEGLNFEIEPKTEFWGHCSNLQTWFEYNYDTKLLHSNLAFPLLKKLSEVGDSLAKKVFKEEIIKRLESGYFPVVEFLMADNYIDFLELEDFLNIVLDWEDSNFKYSILSKYAESLDRGDFLNLILEAREAENIEKLEKRINKKLKLFYDRNAPKSMYIKKNHVLRLNLSNLDLYRFPEEILNLKCLEYIDLSNNILSDLPSSINYLPSLKMINLSLNRMDSKKKEEISNKFSQCQINYSSKLLENAINDIEKRVREFNVIESIRSQELAELLNLNHNLFEKIILFNNEELKRIGLDLKLSNGIVSNNSLID
ncbi:MAG: hypothetical protein ACFFBE_07655 [Promethearchaeota archaeon]